MQSRRCRPTKGSMPVSTRPKWSLSGSSTPYVTLKMPSSVHRNTPLGWSVAIRWKMANPRRQSSARRLDAGADRRVVHLLRNRRPPLRSRHRPGLDERCLGLVQDPMTLHTRERSQPAQAPQAGLERCLALAPDLMTQRSDRLFRLRCRDHDCDLSPPKRGLIYCRWNVIPTLLGSESQEAIRLSLKFITTCGERLVELDRHRQEVSAYTTAAVGRHDSSSIFPLARAAREVFMFRLTKDGADRGAQASVLLLPASLFQSGLASSQLNRIGAKKTANRTTAKQLPNTAQR